MKEKIKERGDTVIAEIDRPIMIVRDKNDHYFIVTESKLGQVVACNLGTESKTEKRLLGMVVGRFQDLQNDLKQFDIKKYEPIVADVKV